MRFFELGMSVLYFLGKYSTDDTPQVTASVTSVQPSERATIARQKRPCPVPLIGWMPSPCGSFSSKKIRHASCRLSILG